MAPKETEQAVGKPAPLMYDAVNSPFIELETPFTAWEAIKMVLLLPTVPLRLAICVMSIFAVAAANSLAIYGCDLARPLPRWRRRAVELASSGSCAVVLRALGFWRPRVVNFENYTRGKEMGAIGIFNHVSYLDAFVVVWGFVCAGVTFRFSKHLPVLGYGVRALQNLYVPEQQGGGGGKDGASNQQSSAVELIKRRAADRNMPMLSVAPEGTLSHGRCLLRFKTGAFVAGTPVVPILLRYKLKPHNPAWTIIHPGFHLLRLMCQLSNSVTIEMLPPYVPSQEERDNPARYAANVRQLMADALGVPLADEDRSHFLALVNAGVRVSWDGRRVVAPPGVLDKTGHLDLAPYLPANFAKNRSKKQQ